MLVRIFFIICLAVSLVGCDSGPKLVPVTGSVTLDGKPLQYKSLYFYPVRSAGTQGDGSGAFTDKEGKYYLIANIRGSKRDQRGVFAGKYRVTVAEPMIPITEADFAPRAVQVDSATPGPGLIPNEKLVKREIPVPYNSESSTPFVVEVPEKGGVIDLELKKNPQP